MKKLMTLFCILISLICEAQTPFNTQVTNWRSYNNTNVTSATTPHSVTPIKVGGGIGDSLAKYLIAEHDSMLSMVSSAGDLQSVLNIGNTATNGGGNVGSIVLSGAGGNTNNIFGNIMEISDGAYKSNIYNSRILIANAGSGTTLALLQQTSGAGTLTLSTATGFGGTILPTGLTGSRKYLLPDEPTAGGVGIQSALVTHTTKDPISVIASGFTSTLNNNVVSTTDGINTAEMFAGTINVSNGTTSSTSSTNGIKTFDVSSGKFVLLSALGAIPKIEIGDAASSFTSVIKTDPLTANRALTEPDRDGQIATNAGNHVSALVSGATTVTITHGLSFTPQRVFVEGNTTSTGTALVGHSITAKTSTTFTITFASPVTGTLEIDWQAF